MACKEKFADKYPCDRGPGSHNGHIHALAKPRRINLFKYKTEAILWFTEEWHEEGKGKWTHKATRTVLLDIPKKDLFLGRF